MRKGYIIGIVVIVIAVCVAFLGYMYHKELNALKDNAEGFVKNIKASSEEVVSTINKGEEQRVILGVLKTKYDDGTCLVTIGNENITCHVENYYVLDDKAVGDSVRVHVYKHVNGKDVNTEYYIEE